MQTTGKNLHDRMEENPIMAAIKNEEGLEAVCRAEDMQVVFVLYGSILSIGEIVSRLHENGKIVFVHIDLIEGLSPREIAVDFIQKHTEADGIISTKPALIHRAKTIGMPSILRIFILDSLAYNNIRSQVRQAGADYLEIVPGVIPKAIKKVTKQIHIPVIAGGMIEDKDEVLAALDAGAAAVSSTNPSVWEL